MSLEKRRLRIEFSTEEAFRSEYTGNIANGGIFIATSEPMHVREPVLVEILLSHQDRRVELEGEVVHRIPPEMADAGALPGVAVQFTLSAKQLRAELEPLIGAGAVAGRVSRSGRRAAPRSPARVRTVLASSSAGEVAGKTRDISNSGMLVSVAGEPLPIGEAIELTIAHPQTGEQLQVGATVVRHIRSEDGEVTAMGIELQTPEARQTEVSSFLNDVQAAEHSRRLGGITGPIAELGIANLLQMFGSSAPQGTVTLSRGAEEGFIIFEAGMLRAARIGRSKGDEALKKLLSWGDGNFEFHARVDEDEPSDPPVALSAAILDALCQLDADERCDTAGEDPAPSVEGEAGKELDLDADLDFGPNEPPGAEDDPSCAVPGRISPETAFVQGAVSADSVRAELSKTEQATLDLALVGMTVAKMVDVIPEREVEVYIALDSLLERGLIRCR